MPPLEQIAARHDCDGPQNVYMIHGGSGKGPGHGKGHGQGWRIIIAYSPLSPTAKPIDRLLS